MTSRLRRGTTLVSLALATTAAFTGCTTEDERAAERSSRPATAGPSDAQLQVLPGLLLRSFAVLDGFAAGASEDEAVAAIEKWNAEHATSRVVEAWQLPYPEGESTRLCVQDLGSGLYATLSVQSDEPSYLRLSEDDCALDDADALVVGDWDAGTWVKGGDRMGVVPPA